MGKNCSRIRALYISSLVRPIRQEVSCTAILILYEVSECSLATTLDKCFEALHFQFLIFFASFRPISAAGALTSKEYSHAKLAPQDRTKN